jgi:hypothetical protein
MRQHPSAEGSVVAFGRRFRLNAPIVAAQHPAYAAVYSRRLRRNCRRRFRRGFRMCVEGVSASGRNPAEACRQVRRYACCDAAYMSPSILQGLSTGTFTEQRFAFCELTRESDPVCAGVIEAEEMPISGEISVPTIP